MSKRSYDPFSDRTQSKSTHEPINAPSEFHEGSAPEYPPLPDEFNRFSSTNDEGEPDKIHARRLMKTMLYFAATGLLVLGILTPNRTLPASSPDPAQAVPRSRGSSPASVPWRSRFFRPGSHG